MSNLDVSEDVLLLWAVVVLHEWLLTAAVPEVQHQVTQQSAQRISHQLKRVGGEGGRHRASVVDPDSMGPLDPWEGPTKI
jgi:hypothetical protein